MALNIRNIETERLATMLAKVTGETKTEAVTRALKDRLARVRRERAGRGLADELEEIATHCSGCQCSMIAPPAILGYET